MMGLNPLEGAGPELEAVSGASGRRVVTHAGSAHADEVLSVALLLAADPAIMRVDRVGQVDPQDLESPEVYVLDIGGLHDPARLDFDHHQFPSGGQPRCTFSLLLEHLGLSERARNCWPWLDYLIRMDVGGPGAVASHAGLPDLASLLPCLASPMERALVDGFSDAGRLLRTDVLAEALEFIGRQLLAELREIPEAVKWYKDAAVMRVIPAVGRGVGPGAQDDAPGRSEIRVIMIAGWPPGPPSLARKGFERYLAEAAGGASIVVFPDERGAGWVLRGCSVADPWDFGFLRGHPMIAFVHGSGFLAVTRHRREEDLERVLALVAAGHG